jgi:2-dehydro-3-deoxyphosphogluconate aldolase / (4S)-4-hydroxy-2-oxoglutarate aldolase
MTESSELTGMLDLEPSLHALGVVPVVSLADVTAAVPMAQALFAGGLPCAEITFRTDAAAAAIETLRTRSPEMLVGAGTVLSTGQVDTAISAGAMFVVAPGFNPAVVDHCLARGIPVIPGVVTPSEIEQALGRHLRLVKFFPAEASGGVPYLRAVAGPYPMMRFVPTGGVGIDNLADYLALPNVTACGGTWICPSDVLASGRFDVVEALAREAVNRVRALRGT